VVGLFRLCIGMVNFAFAAPEWRRLGRAAGAVGTMAARSLGPPPHSSRKPLKRLMKSLEAKLPPVRRVKHAPRARETASRNLPISG
jgi:hypothetical protein